jgi:hypothetical protein
MTVRVPQVIDLPRFSVIPRATPQFGRRSKGQTAVERVNEGSKVRWGADDGNGMGSRRFSAHVARVLIVHLAFATLLARAQRREGPVGTMWLSPVANKLRQLTGEKASHAP